MHVIYKILNIKTNDFYIGSATNYYSRKSIHIKELKENKHHNNILQNSWNKHGESFFEFSIIEIVSDKLDLINREQFYIDSLNPKYNICRVAGSPLGIKHTETARKNMSLAHIGINRGHKSDCNCTICKPKKGKDSYRYKPREFRICICGCGKSFECMKDSDRKYINHHNKSQLGIKRDKSVGYNHSIRLKEFYKNNDNVNCIPILQLSTNGILINEFNSITDARNKLHMSFNDIKKCLIDESKTHKGFIFKYKNKYIITNIT